MNKPLDIEALEPCPFCGGAPTVGPTRSMHMVECNNAECLVNPDALAAFEHDAIAAWNRRAAKRDGASQLVESEAKGYKAFQLAVMWQERANKAEALLASQAAPVVLTPWISVANQVPASKFRVLIAYTNHHGKQARTIGWYVKRWAMASHYFDGEVDDESDENGEYYIKEGWVDESAESEYHYPISNVTHWMPLPEAPAIESAITGQSGGMGGAG